MTSELFRPEALEHQVASASRFGRPTGVLPPSWSRITFLLAVFIGALLIFLLSVDFARKETVRGKLRIDGAEAKIYALEAGLITQVLIEDGQSVEAGQPIAVITTDRFMSGGVALSEATLASLAVERESLLRRKASIETTAGLSQQEAEQRNRDALRRESEAAAQRTVARRRLEIARKRAADAETFLAEGLIAEPQLNDRLDAVAQLEQNTLQSEAQVSEAKAVQRRTRLEKQQIRATLTRDLTDIDQRLSQIDSQAQRTRADTAHVIHAPIAGRLTALQARVGEQAVNGIPLAVILPQGSTLIAEVYLPSRAIGFVTPGQVVKLQYDAFPYQKFGVAYGDVVNVASTAQLPQEIGVNSQAGEPLYRVAIRLDKQRLKRSRRRSRYRQEWSCRPISCWKTDVCWSGY